MNIKDLICNTDTLHYKELCSALIERFGVKQAVKWDSVLPHEQQQTLFGGEILRLVSDHPALANHKEIRPICLMKGELSQLLFFYVQLKDEKLPKSAIERITRKFIGGTAAERYVIWFLGNKNADVFKIVISGKEGKKVKQKTLTLEAGQWFKTYDYILSEVERKFNTNGLFREFKEPSGLWKAIWEAFDISIVNKKFYAEIKEVFDALTKEYLPKCKGILTNDQDRVQFAIRLIGRIIFCWFLKRKSIVADDVMSARAVQAQQNFYRDLLEPLFFDVFNTPPNERRKDLPDVIKNYPFLNGGLFEPQSHDYKGNWALTIPNDWFINFFGNTLERYNFTVDENSAASSEIAIDPEMLGRIFENLLAEHNPETGESARKATGSYYTPREIVDFMVEESLIAYLKTSYVPSPPVGEDKAKIPSPLVGEGKGEGGFDPFIEDFVHTGTFPEALKAHSKGLLDKLNVIKVLDPACGSGAFPISMLQKLVGLKQQLDPKTSPYDLKLKTIENSIYGVDIQPMATELSRLRCWLSLIVDEDPKNIKPLPNLDFKFVTANSLIDLGYDEFINKVKTGKIGSLFLKDFIKSLDALKAVRQKYFEPSLHQRDKDKLKKEFTTISNELFKMSLELIKQRLLDTEFANRIIGWDPFDDSKPAPFFNKSWMFGVENGFDVVIANPPYVRQEAIKHLKPFLLKAFPDFYCGTADIYTYFYKCGIDQLRPGGHLCFIAPNKFMRAGYGKNTRVLLTTQVTPKLIIDFGDLPIFDATTYPAIILVEKNNVGAGLAPAQIKGQPQGLPLHNGQFLAATFTNAGQLTCVEETLSSISFPMTVSSLRAEGWNLECPEVLGLMEKLRKAGMPLCDYVQGRLYRGVLTGLNEAFVIDETTRKQLIAEDPASADLIKPWLRGRDIKKWKAEWAGLHVIFTRRGTNIEKYPAIRKYLLQFRKDLEPKKSEKDKHGRKPGSYQWYEIQDNIAYYEEFEQTKITWGNLATEPKFAFDDSGGYISAPANIIPTNDLCLLAILNSPISKWWISLQAAVRSGGFLEYKPMYVGGIPVFPATDSQKVPIIKLVQTILADPDGPTVQQQEAEIDRLVYELYGLNDADITIVESLSKR